MEHGNDATKTRRVLLASLVFGPLFLPVSSPPAQLLAAYASFGLAFVARPVGAVVFGHYGDRVGRKATLVVSLLLMCQRAPKFPRLWAFRISWVGGGSTTGGQPDW